MLQEERQKSYLEIGTPQEEKIPSCLSEDPGECSAKNWPVPTSGFTTIQFYQRNNKRIRCWTTHIVKVNNTKGIIQLRHMAGVKLKFIYDLFTKPLAVHWESQLD